MNLNKLVLTSGFITVGKKMNCAPFYRKVRYFSLSNSFIYSLSYLPQTLVSPYSSLSNSKRLITNFTSHPLYCLVSSTRSCSFCFLTTSLSQSSSILNCCAHNSYHINQKSRIHNHSLPRWFTVTSDSALLPRPNPIAKRTEIVEMIKTNTSDLESKLKSMNVSLSISYVIDIFQILNSQKVSGLRFFDWIIKAQPEISCNSDICSLVIDNCLRLDDYDSMISILKEFNLRQVRLKEDAFGYILHCSSNEPLDMNSSIKRVIEVLNEVGGSCRSTGIRALIKMVASVGFYDNAKHVMDLTERTTSYYNILIIELCRNSKFKEAQEILEEMKRFGCDPTAKSYNYLLSSLCKNDMMTESYTVLEEMRRNRCPPDEITFEIFILFLCRSGKFDIAFEFLNQMVEMGIEPRVSTHEAFIKCYFRMKKYEEAYDYVVGVRKRFKYSSNMAYSLLASLYLKNGDFVAAHKILMEMIGIGLKPIFSVYVRVSKSLYNSGKGYLSSDLKNAFSSLGTQPSIKTG